MAETKQKITFAAYKSQTPPDWCPGCGDFGVLNSLQTACAMLEIDPSQLMVVSGIGCSSNLPGFIRAYGFHSLHGRAVPVASGIKLGNHDLHVIITGGDGDGYGIGLGHFVHAMRRNLNITYIVMNNEIYGLTTGQASPTTMKSTKTKSTPYGSIESQLNPEALALVSGASFIARGFSGEPQHLAETMKKAIQHKGFSLVDVMSPCVTYNKLNTYSWFRERVYKLEGENHDTSNYEAALKKSFEWDLRIPLGVFYEVDRPTYEDEEGALEFGPLVKQKLGLKDEDWQALIKENL
jgi:2-oxoglutarate ferredoxin oxidoreductase subunit beta